MDVDETDGGGSQTTQTRLDAAIEPSTPEFWTIWRIGASSALSTIMMPACTSGFSGELVDRLLGAEQGHAAARHDAFLDVQQP